MKNDDSKKNDTPPRQPTAWVRRLLTPQEVGVVSGGNGYAEHTAGYCRYSQAGTDYTQHCVVRQ